MIASTYTCTRVHTSLSLSLVAVHLRRDLRARSGKAEESAEHPRGCSVDTAISGTYLPATALWPRYFCYADNTPTTDPAIKISHVCFPFLPSPTHSLFLSFFLSCKVMYRVGMLGRTIQKHTHTHLLGAHHSLNNNDSTTRQFRL